MAWTTLKADIADIIKANGVGAITGNVLQDVLNNLMVDGLGVGQYKGIAVPATNPTLTDGPMFYIASAPGTYTNFDAYELVAGIIVTLRWSGTAWLTPDVIVDLTTFSWDLTMDNNQIKELGPGTADDDAATFGQVKSYPVDLEEKGIIETGLAGEILIAGNVVYLKTDGKWWIADNSAEATGTPELRLAPEDMAADETGEFILIGDFTTTGLTAGKAYYLGTAGAITATRPGTGAYVRYIGTALSTTVLRVNIDSGNDYDAGGGYTLPLASATRGGIKADTKGGSDTVEAKIDGTTEKLYVPTYPVLPVKATYTEINTGSDDDKFATSRAIKDSNILQLGKAAQFAVVDAKATAIVDADTVLGEDSEASGAKKRFTWALIKSTLKSYFDTLYNLYAHPNHTGEVTSTGDGATVIAATAISGKTNKPTLAGTEEVLINDAGTLKKAPVSALGGGTGGLLQRDGSEDVHLIDETKHNAWVYKSPDASSQAGTTHKFIAGDATNPILITEILQSREVKGTAVDTVVYTAFDERVKAREAWVSDEDSYSTRTKELYGNEEETQFNRDQPYFQKLIRGVFVDINRGVLQAANGYVIARYNYASKAVTATPVDVVTLQIDVVAVADWAVAGARESTEYVIRMIAATDNTLEEIFRITKTGNIKFNAAYTFPKTSGTVGDLMKVGSAGVLAFGGIAFHASIADILDWASGALIAKAGMATGAMIYFDGTKLTLISIGSTGQVMKVAGGLPTWAAEQAYTAGEGLELSAYTFNVLVHADANLVLSTVGGLKRLNTIQGIRTSDIPTFASMSLIRTVSAGTGCALTISTIGTAPSELRLGRSGDSEGAITAGDITGTIGFYSTWNFTSQSIRMSAIFRLGYKSDWIIEQAEDISTWHTRLRLCGDATNFGKWKVYEQYLLPTVTSGDDGKYMKYNHATGAMVLDTPAGSGGAFTEVVVSDLTASEIAAGERHEFAVNIGVGKFLIDSILVYSTAVGTDITLDFNLEVYRKTGGELGTAGDHSLTWALDFVYAEDNIRLHNTQLTAAEPADETALAVDSNALLWKRNLILVDEEEYHRVSSLTSTTGITVYDGLVAAQADNDPVWQIYERNNLGMFYNGSSANTLYVNVENNDATNARTYKVIVKATKLA